MVVGLFLPVVSFGQGINYPGNSPISTTGAGNARVDPDNLFTRNNIAGLSEIETEAGGRNRWRVFGEVQGTFYSYDRRPGINAEVSSRGKVGVPNASGEVTFTSSGNRFGFGVGLSQVFGFQSKLKDLSGGPGAQFFDTKIASHDVTVAGAARINKRFSVGASVIFGRVFLKQIGTIPELAAIGIIRQSHLDVSDIGGVGYSFGANVRPSSRIRLGINFKTKRKYTLGGAVETFQPVAGPSGLQLIPVKPPVNVPFSFPAVLETGISVKPTQRLLIAFDHRYYFYQRSLESVVVQDAATSAPLASQSVRARNVSLFLLGGTYALNKDHALNFGTGYVSNAVPDETFYPGLMNTGGKSITAGLSRQIDQTWWTVSISKYSGNPRTIESARNPLFAGIYENGGFTIGLAFRRWK